MYCDASTIRHCSWKTSSKHWKKIVYIWNCLEKPWKELDRSKRSVFSPFTGSYNKFKFLPNDFRQTSQVGLSMFLQGFVTRCYECVYVDLISTGVAVLQTAATTPGCIALFACRVFVRSALYAFWFDLSIFSICVISLMRLKFSYLKLTRFHKY